MTIHAAKVVVLGEGAVGKTSLVRRYVDRRFDKDYVATIGVNVKNKELPDIDIHMNIWDIYGQKSISPGKHSSNYIGAEGAVVVFDLTRKKTFSRLDDWIKDLFEVTGKIPVLLLGNKKDIIEDFEEVNDTIFTMASQKEFHDYMVENHYYRNVYSAEPEFTPVSFSESREWASEKNPFNIKFPFLITSAKTGENVDKAFDGLAQKIVSNKIKYH